MRISLPDFDGFTEMLNTFTHSNFSSKLSFLGRKDSKLRNWRNAEVQEATGENIQDSQEQLGN